MRMARQIAPGAAPAAFVGDLRALEFVGRQSGLANQRPKRGRLAVNELRAELDGDVRRQVMGVNPSADPVAGLDEGHAQARAREQACGGKTGDSCADDHHIDGGAHSWV